MSINSQYKRSKHLDGLSFHSDIKPKPKLDDSLDDAATLDH